jgi:ADP-heptose:LPS heptosyltransferase
LRAQSRPVRLKRAARLLLLRAVAFAGRPLLQPTGNRRFPERLRLLLIRPDHLGDALLVTPALQRMRALLPDAHLTCLCGPWSREVFVRAGVLDAVQTCSFPGFDRTAPHRRGSVLAPYLLLAREARRLRRQGFDVAINLRFDFWWGALLAFCAGIPLRLGYDVPEAAPFLTHSLPWPPSAGRLPHATQANALLVELCAAVLQHAQAAGQRDNLAGVHPAARPLVLEAGHPPGERRVPLPPLCFLEAPADVLGLERTLGAAGVPNGGHGCIVLHPGSGGAVKLWPVEYWQAVAGSAAALGRPVVVTGSASERDLAIACVVGVPGCTVLAGKLSLGELAALFRRAALVVGTDNGALHLAVACGAPTLQVYGPSDAAQFGPFGPPERHRVLRADVPCAPCGYLDMPVPAGTYKACMRSITPERVIAAMTAMLASSTTSPGNRTHPFSRSTGEGERG